MDIILRFDSPGGAAFYIEFHTFLLDKADNLLKYDRGHLVIANQHNVDA